MLKPLFTVPEPAQRRLPSQKQPRQPREQTSTSRTFEFVASDAAGKPAPEARKFIRSYVMRGKNTKRHNNLDKGRLGVSWFNHKFPPPYQAGRLVAPLVQSHVDDDVTRQYEEHGVLSAPFLPGPLRPPPDLTLFNFANPVDETSRFLLHRFFAFIKQSMYPVEWCFEFDLLQVCWFRWLLVDAAYLHSVLFMMSAFQDLSSKLGIGSNGKWEVTFSAQTHHLLRRTIQLLQARIQDHREQLLDSTAAVVTTLAMVADASGDTKAHCAHIEGLRKIVMMRGGLQGFQGNRQIQIKICRLDLGWSIKNATKPTFFDGDVSWKPFLATVIRNLGLDVDQTSSMEMQNLFASWDPKLRIVFIDLRDFSRMVNLLLKERRKIQPELFQEIMLSIQYRLLLLNYTSQDDPLNEAVRLGLLAFESTLFLQIPGLKLKYMVFDGHMRSAIEKIEVTGSVLSDLKLWLLFYGGIIVFDTSDPWVVSSIQELTIGETWDNVQRRLKRIMWIDAAHGGPACEVFHAVWGV